MSPLDDLLSEMTKILVSMKDRDWDAIRLEVMKDGLKISIGVGWPDAEDEEDEDEE